MNPQSSSAALGAVIAAFLTLAAWCRPVAAQSPLGIASPRPQKFDELRLKPDAPISGVASNKPGRVLHGVVMEQTPDSVDFTEIRQPPGRPMSLVVLWRFPRSKIDLLVPVDAESHKALLNWIDNFKTREQTELDILANLPLQKITGPNGEQWHYESPLWSIEGAKAWLIIDSTAERETTERCILRIEQVLTAYHEVLPPRTQPTRPLQVKLFGSMPELQSFLVARKLPIANPAMFSPKENLLVAGSELSAYAADLAEVRKHHEQVAAELATFDNSLKEKLATYRKQLAAGGYSANEQNKLVDLTKASWSKERQEIESRIKTAERLNNRQFDEVTHAMFVRLFHEAFHAYLENYVFPQAHCDVPRWLNEGLAQIFEGGQLEAGALRLDAPDPDRLQNLKNDLRSAGALRLADVLEADQSAFLVYHPGGSHASKQHYLYSWGLAYYLTFRQPMLETADLDLYVARQGEPISPIKRFERLVGMPLDKFEARWRADMLAMKSPPQ